jgi:hypothetical protein
VRHRKLSILTVLMALTAVTASAQFNSAIQGTVSDPSRGVIPDAAVRVSTSPQLYIPMILAGRTI